MKFEILTFLPVLGACVLISIGCAGPQRELSASQSNVTWIEDDFLKRKIVRWVVWDRLGEEWNYTEVDSDPPDFEYFLYRAWVGVMSFPNAISSVDGVKRLRWVFPVDAEGFLLGSPAGPDFRIPALDSASIIGSVQELFRGFDLKHLNLEVIDFGETDRIAALGHFDGTGFFFLDWNGRMTIGEIFALHPPHERARTHRTHVYREGERIELDDEFERMLLFELRPGDILILPWRTVIPPRWTEIYLGRPRR